MQEEDIENIREADNRYYDTLLPSDDPPSSSHTISYNEQIQKALLESQTEYELQQVLLIEKNCELIEKEKSKRTALLQPIMRYWKYSEISKTTEIYDEINLAIDSFKLVQSDKIYLFPKTYELFTAFLQGISSRVSVESIQDILESF